MKKFKIHDRIINHIGDHHIFAIVQDIKEDGSLVVRNERYGKWIASPDKCQRFDEPHNFK